MPIYERRCARCDAVFEHLCNSDDRLAPKDCPNCGHDFTSPIMSATRTDFKHADRSAIKRIRQ